MSLVLYIYNICPVSENLFFFQKLTASPSHSKKTAHLSECGFSFKFSAEWRTSAGLFKEIRTCGRGRNQPGQRWPCGRAR